MPALDSGSRRMMARARRQRGLLMALLVLGMVIACVRFASPLGDATPRAGFAAAPEQVPGPSEKPILVTWPVTFERNPFDEKHKAPPPAPPKPIPPSSPTPEEIRNEAKALLSLKAIVGSTPHRALINGQMHVEGDRVAGFRIVRIEARRVVLERDGVGIELKL